MSFEAVLFDVDGTLLNTIDDIADSMNTVLRRWDFPEHDVESYKYFVGEGVEKLVERALPPGYRNGDPLARCIAAMREEYTKRRTEKTRPYEGVPRLLDGLAQHHIPMTILSNKPDDQTKLIVSELLPHWSFEIVLGARSSVPKKPDPVAAFEIAHSLNIPVENFLYVGDTRTDMETARRAGMYPAGALWGFRTREELVEAGAKTVVESPLDILQFFPE